MNYLENVQKGIDYIESNLDFELPLAKVAGEAGISQWHFQRIFKALTNETLKQYIRSRRLSNSLNELLNTQKRIIDIALNAGFESQESFTRAFKKAFELTPNQYRKHGNNSLFLKKVEINADYLHHINQNISLSPEIYEQKKMQFIGLKTMFHSVDSEKNNIGEKLPPLWDDFLKRVDEIKNAVPGLCYGIIKQTKDKTDHLEYYAVIEVTHVETIPDKMVQVMIPPSTYAKFTHKGAAKDFDKTVNYIYSNWLIQSGKHHTYEADMEFYGPEYHPVSNKSTMYYAIPISD